MPLSACPRVLHLVGIEGGEIGDQRLVRGSGQQFAKGSFVHPLAPPIGSQSSYRAAIDGDDELLPGLG